MAITSKKPPMKETVGAQYICFNKMNEENEWTKEFETDVEKTEVVKSVKVTENSENTDAYASGKVYDSDTSSGVTNIEVEVIAFPVDTLSKMRGDQVDEGGLILAGGSRNRPFFAYGKVVKLKNDKYRYEWFPKCRLAGNSDEISTREEKFTEQNDTFTITAYAFNESGDTKTYVDSSSSVFPKDLTEDKFFGKPIMTKEDLAAAVSKV